MLSNIKFDTFKTRLFLVIVLMNTLTIAILSFFWISYSRVAVSQSVRRDLRELAIKSAGEIEQYFLSKTDTLISLSGALSLDGRDEYRLRMMLKRFTLDLPEFMSLSLYDMSGRVLSSTYDAGFPALGGEELSSVASGRIYRSDMMFTEKGLPEMHIGVPIVRMGQVQSILLAEIDILTVWNNIDEIRIGNTGRASLYSGEGIFLADPDKSRVLKRQGIKDIYGTDLRMETEDGSLEIKDLQGNALFAAYAPVQGMGWSVLISQSEREALHYQNVMIFQAFILIIISLFVSYVLANIISAHISSPVEDIHLGVSEISKGNLEFRIPAQSIAEFKDLSAGFNSMAVSLMEKRRLEEELTKADKLIAVAKMAGDISHEINNPLGIIKNYIYLIRVRKLPADDPIQRYLKIIDQEIDRIARIIISFNDFYKGLQTLTLERVELLEPLNDVLNLFEMEISSRGITIRKELDESGTVMASRDKMKQVFINLIKNAMESMKEGGRIGVKTEKSDGRIHVYIMDTGEGISKDNLYRLFTPFFSTKGVQGTGLGLSVSYGIIKNFNGDISATSILGKGTTFKISLPLVH